MFEEAVLSLGGSRDDIALLENVSADGELVQGEQETDVRITLQASLYHMHTFSDLFGIVP